VSAVGIAPLAALSVAVLTLVWGMSPALGSRSMIVTALLCSVPLSILLAGIRWRTADPRSSGLPLSQLTASRWRQVVVIHGHHDSLLASRGKEIVVARKSFCAGCYGLIVGTVIGDAIALRYLASDFERGEAITLTALLPLLFAPIIARYSGYRRMPPGVRLVSNALLAVGCWLVLLVADAWAASIFVNLSIFAAFGLIALMRQVAALKENESLSVRPVTVRP
jgi:hypothetical protein